MAKEISGMTMTGTLKLTGSHSGTKYNIKDIVQITVTENTNEKVTYLWYKITTKGKPDNLIIGPHTEYFAAKTAHSFTKNFKHTVNKKTSRQTLIYSLYVGVSSSLSTEPTSYILLDDTSITVPMLGSTTFQYHFMDKSTTQVRIVQGHSGTIRAPLSSWNIPGFECWNSAKDGTGTMWHVGDTYTCNSITNAIIHLYPYPPLQIPLYYKIDGKLTTAEMQKLKVDGKIADTVLAYIKIDGHWCRIAKA